MNATRTLINGGIESITVATEKHGKQVENQIAAAQALGTLALASAVLDLADALKTKP